MLLESTQHHRFTLIKSPSQLTLHESAMLVGMAKNPSLFNPIRRPDTVLKRRGVVLYQMFKK